jgi:hypothetical protein
MSKKQTIPSHIQQQFEKPHFNIGDAVFFIWLGFKKYGYVKTHKQTNWGVQYTVEANDTRYPCGIRIEEHQTQYATGCILYDETRELGSAELIRRIAAGESPRLNIQTHNNIGSSETPSRNDDTSERTVSRTSNSKKQSNTAKGNGVENGVKLSNTRVRRDNSAKRNTTQSTPITNSALTKFIRPE